MLDADGKTKLVISWSGGFKPSSGDQFVLFDLVKGATQSDLGIFGATYSEGEKFEKDGYVFSISYKGGEDKNDVVLTVGEAPELPETGFASDLLLDPATMTMVFAGAAALSTTFAFKMRRRKF